MTRRIALGGVLAALAIALHMALTLIPNVELTSLTLFVAGWLLGPRLGILTALVATVSFSLTSPYGLPAPPMLLAQCLGYASWSFVGAQFGSCERAPDRLQAGTAGMFLTSWFQLLVNGAIWWVTGTPLLAILLPAFPFTLTHIVSNTLAFGILLPPLGPHLVRLQERMKE
jgi:hypothetical protein